MKIKNLIYPVLFGVFGAYLGTRLQKQIEKGLKRRETPDYRGGANDRVGFWLRLLELHRGNLPFVIGTSSAVGSGAVLKYNEQLAQFLCVTIFSSSLYEKISTKNMYIKALEQRQIVNKFVEASSLLQAFELTPRMTDRERLSGFKLILMDLLKCDTKIKLIYNTIGLATLLIYLFTGNFLVFTHMIWALVQLIKRGSISKGVGKVLVMLLRKKGIPIPEELEEVLSE